MENITIDFTPAEAQLVVDALASIGGLGPLRDLAEAARNKFLEQGIDYSEFDSPDFPFEENYYIHVKEN